MYQFLKRIIMFSMPAIIMLFIISCDEVDSEKQWGIAKIYMPQASLQSGGLDNFYYVPSGSNEYNKNYTIDSLSGENNINVVLGVYRSGLEELDGYSVNVVTKADTVNQLISNGVLTNTVLLPEDVYSMPESITVPSGEREAIFYLKINRNTLLNNYPAYSGMSLALAVSITNPTKYELNPDLSTTVVIIEPNWDTLK